MSLSGTATDDDPEDAPTYSWIHDGAPSITITGSDSASASFTAPNVAANTTITVTLTVNDGTVDASDTLHVTITDSPNRPPTVNAGQDQEVAEGATVSLSGTATDGDPEDTPTYSWTHDGAPSITITGSDSASASFTAPNVAANTTITVTLTVNDGTVDASDTLQVTITDSPNSPPTVNAGQDQEVAEGATVSLSGTATDGDPEDAPTYSWTHDGAPSITITGSDSASASFTAPNVAANTTITVTLTVNDGTVGVTDTLQVTITDSPNRPPTVNAGQDQEVAEGATVSLSGTATDGDPEDTLTYAWSHNSTLSFALDDDSAPDPSFTAPNVAEDTPVLFTLAVTDGTATATDSLVVTITDSPVQTGSSSASWSVDQVIRILGSKGGHALDMHVRCDEGTMLTDARAGTYLQAMWQQFGTADLNDAIDLSNLHIDLDWVNRVPGEWLIFRSIHYTPNDRIAEGIYPLDAGITINQYMDAASSDIFEYPTGNYTKSQIGNWEAYGLSIKWEGDGSCRMDLDHSNIIRHSPSTEFTAPQVNVTTTASANRVATVETPKASLGPRDIGRITLNGTAPGTVGVSWDAPGETPAGYRVMWAKVGESYRAWTDSAGNAYPTSPFQTITGLDGGAEYKVKVRATYDGDSGDWSGEATVAVARSPANDPPTVDAGNAQTVQEGLTVTLNGTASDPDGDALTYLWSHDSAMNVTFSDPSSLAASFTAPQVDSNTTITITLTVSDGNLTVSDSVDVTVTDAPVQVSQSDPRGVYRLTLSSTESGVIEAVWDAPGEAPIDYRISWAKAGESYRAWTDSVGNAFPTDASYTITDLEEGAEYKVQVRARYDGTAGDWSGEAATAVARSPANDPPTVDAGNAQTVQEGLTVTLNGTASDPDGDALTYLWSHDSAMNVTFSDPSSLVASFTAPQVDSNTTITITLTVSDGNLTVSDSVDVTVTDAPVQVSQSDPRGVYRLTLSSTESGVIEAVWDAPGEAPIDYRISWAKAGESYRAWTDSAGNAFPTDASYTITDLEEGAEYKVQVRARYNGTAGDWSGEITITVAGTN